ncbi:MAG TPA: flagellar brake domain-containing protein [Bacillales bacterium]|nr:flagellar brake domain-containing protein [Bacillales bacterium]
MKIGTTVFMNVSEDKYRSRVVEERKGLLFIDLPIDMDTSRTSLLDEGTAVKVFFTDVDNTAYTFDSTVKGRRLGRVPMLVLECPDRDRFTRLQRREFVRISDSVDVAVHPMEERFPAFTTTSFDLSGGGMAIRLPKNHGLKEKMGLRCWVVLPMRSGKLNYLSLPCKVIRVFHPRKEATEIASLTFTSIKESEQQQIIRYCFEQQLSRKGKTTVR